MRCVTSVVFDLLQGAQEVFNELPVEYVEADHLPKVAKHGCKYE